eukprot:SAG22_NODE_1360_length_4622_cov_2.212912_2_plen_147_part_00
MASPRSGFGASRNSPGGAARAEWTQLHHQGPDGGRSAPLRAVPWVWFGWLPALFVPMAIVRACLSAPSWLVCSESPLPLRLSESRPTRAHAGCFGLEIELGSTQAVGYRLAQQIAGEGGQALEGVLHLNRASLVGGVCAEQTATAP